jgi:hypothetical protein
MHQQFWGYKIEEKLYLGVREQKRLNTTVIDNLYNPHGTSRSGPVTSCTLESETGEFTWVRHVDDVVETSSTANKCEESLQKMAKLKTSKEMGW